MFGVTGQYFRQATLLLLLLTSARAFCSIRSKNRMPLYGGYVALNLRPFLGSVCGGICLSLVRKKVLRYPLPGD